jgi:hypothetical protein
VRSEILQIMVQKFGAVFSWHALSKIAELDWLSEVTSISPLSGVEAPLLQTVYPCDSSLALSQAWVEPPTSHEELPRVVFRTEKKRVCACISIARVEEVLSFDRRPTKRTSGARSFWSASRSRTQRRLGLGFLHDRG